MSEVRGLEELRAEFARIGDAASRKVLRHGAAAGSIIAADAVRAKAPIAARAIRRKGNVYTAPGTLQRAVLRRFAREKSNDAQAVYVVTVRKGKNLARSAFYAPWVEQGHRIVPRKGKPGSATHGVSLRERRRGPTGFVAARPFFEPAITESYDKIVEAMVRTARQDLATIPGISA